MASTIHLVGGDNAGREIENKYGFKHGDCIELPPRPKLGSVDVRDLSDIADVVDLEIYKLHDFRIDFQGKLTYAAPQDWSTSDIMLELWRVYSEEKNQ